MRRGQEPVRLLLAPRFHPTLVDPTQETEKALEDRERMWRAPRDVEIYREDVVRAVVDLRMTDIRPARDRARPGGNDDLGWRNRVVGLLESEPHVLGDRSGDEQAVGVPMYVLPQLTAWRTDIIAGPIGEWNSTIYGSFFNANEWYLVDGGA